LTGHPVVFVGAALQAGAARVGASTTSRPAALALRIDGRAILEPAYTVVVVASETRILCGPAPADALLVVERAASSLVFAFLLALLFVFSREFWAAGEYVFGPT